jgi:hypothetical protein
MESKRDLASPHFGLGSCVENFSLLQPGFSRFREFVGASSTVFGRVSWIMDDQKAKEVPFFRSNFRGGGCGSRRLGFWLRWEQSGAVHEWFAFLLDPLAAPCGSLNTEYYPCHCKSQSSLQHLSPGDLPLRLGLRRVAIDDDRVATRGHDFITRDSYRSPRVINVTRGVPSCPCPVRRLAEAIAFSPDRRFLNSTSSHHRCTTTRDLRTRR